MESMTVSLTGTSSTLEAHFFPPIELSSNKNYVLGLVELLSCNSIPNVDEYNNIFIAGNFKLTIPTGSYELQDLEKYIKEHLREHDIEFSLKPNNSTLHSEIKCSEAVNFKIKNSIGSLLGFSPKILKANKIHSSDLPVRILKINSLRVECNITVGAYINGEKVHTIHQFFPSVPPGFKIIEVPSHIIYLPIGVKCIDYIQLRIVDQDGDLVNFRNEVITIRLHIKSTT